jgi:hypothetical protein
LQDVGGARYTTTPESLTAVPYNPKHELARILTGVLSASPVPPAPCRRPFGNAPLALASKGSGGTGPATATPAYTSAHRASGKTNRAGLSGNCGYNVTPGRGLLPLPANLRRARLRGPGTGFSATPTDTRHKL